MGSLVEFIAHHPLCVLPPPTSHNKVLGLMVKQNASEILPVCLGDLTCNGIIYKHDTTTLHVLGDQSSRLSTPASEKWEDGVCSSGGSFININGTEATSTGMEVE